MKRKVVVLSSILLFVCTFLTGCVSQQQRAFDTVKLKTHSAVTPESRDIERPWGTWMGRHESFNRRVQQGNVDIIFVGDSITHRWETDGKNVWQKYYKNRNAVNLGIGGDRTQHVLWRLDHGNIDGISPKVAVVMIGTNNHPPNNTPEEIADGIIAICAKLREKLPDTKILLLGIFPRGEKPNEWRSQLAETSKMASKIADGKTIYYLDIGDKFLEPDGSISKDIMYDYLHLTEKGYEIWAEAMEPTLTELMKE